MKVTPISESWPATNGHVYARRSPALLGLLLLSACGADTSPPVQHTFAGAAAVTSTPTSGTGSAGKPSAGSPAVSIPTAGRPAVSTAGTSGGGGSTPTGPTAGKPAGSAGSGGAAMTGTGGSGSTGTPDKSAGCGMPKPTLETSIMVGGMEGKIIVDVPADYDSSKAYPLLLVWHGAMVQNTDFHEYLNMKAVAGKEAIIVTPECLGGGGNWPNDMSYPDALLEHFEGAYCIDKKRVFTTGHSMGGMYTAMIGCQRGDKFRADAVLAAPHNASGCVKGNMAAMMSVGMDDFVANYTTEFAYWAMYGGCDASMKTVVDPTTFAMGTPEESGHCDEYGGCAAGTPVRVCTFAGGHEIPGWVAGAVWSFFKKQ